jgi:hypothetical protein
MGPAGPETRKWETQDKGDNGILVCLIFSRRNMQSTEDLSSDRYTEDGADR